MRFTRLRKLGTALVLLALAAGSFTAGAIFQDTEARAEVRHGETQPHFKSGAQRSEQILRGMADTLKSIDARLERIEKLADRHAKQDAVETIRERRGR